MKKTSNAEAAPAAVEQAVLARDEFTGLGGSFIYDPASGKRTPADKPVEQPAEGQVNDE
ncbi:hypothetical protein [Pseudoduganella lurida]|uniref:hypothetical protein n=1 Tax=Pseudoduganella lurida TaxID=1036180 RepID=UPI00131504F8|nr:hypothetical protein [Pseudoduganella lurida]